jgi:hypothetical protein
MKSRGRKVRRRPSTSGATSISTTLSFPGLRPLAKPFSAQTAYDEQLS